MWKCPNCDETLECLRYSVSTTCSEYGTADLEGEPSITALRDRGRNSIITNYDCDDQGSADWDGDPTYECPECGEELTPRGLIWKESDDEDEDEDEDETITKKKVEIEPEETKHNIVKPKTPITEDEYDEDVLECSMICKECMHLYVYNPTKGHPDDEAIFGCPKCGEPNEQGEFRSLLKDGFFNKKIIEKHGRTKKTKHRPIPAMGKSRGKIHHKVSRHK